MDNLELVGENPPKFVRLKIFYNMLLGCFLGFIAILPLIIGFIIYPPLFIVILVTAYLIFIVESIIFVEYKNFNPLTDVYLGFFEKIYNKFKIDLGLE